MILPHVSEPRANGASPAATALAEPDDEPPYQRRGGVAAAEHKVGPLRLARGQLRSQFGQRIVPRAPGRQSIEEEARQFHRGDLLRSQGSTKIDHGRKVQIITVQCTHLFKYYRTPPRRFGPAAGRCLGTGPRQGRPGTLAAVAEVTSASHTAENLRGGILKYGPDLQGPPPTPPGRNDRWPFLPHGLRRERREPGGHGGQTACAGNHGDQ